MGMDENNHFDNVDVSKGSFTPVDWTLPRLHEIMVEITMECKVGASNVFLICLAPFLPP
jgi:hypothetical protein